MSWYQFTREIFRCLELEVKVRPIKTKDLTLRAQRPVMSALKNEKLAKYGLIMPTWQEALKDYLRERGYFKGKS